jgi:hypothetical protein
MLLRKLQEKLVDEGRRLQRMFAALTTKIGYGEPVKFVIDKGHQFIACLFLTVVPAFQQLSDAFGGGDRHSLISLCLACEWAICEGARWA